MAMIDWDWPAQFETCQARIAELEERIASQKEKIQRLLKRNMNAIFAQRILAIWEESLERVQSHKHLIEIRIGDRAADQHHALPFFDEPKQPSDLMRLRRAEGNADAAAQSQ
jgi:uncharacterized coiled-coil protein SlyX